MSIFSVVATSTPAEVEKKLSNTFPPADVHKVDDKFWFVSSATLNTPREFCDKAGLTGAATGTVIVMLVASYYGYHTKTNWEWLASKGV